MDLKQLQQNFKQHIFDQDSNIARHIVSDALSGDFRLGIYANAYVSRLIEALESDYPVLRAMTGETAFYDLCRVYIQQHPSTYTSLRWFGKDLPEFLKNTDELFPAEMAGFEWALVDAFNAADQSNVTEGDMAQVAPEKWPELRFEFHPSVRIVQFQWNILPIWQAHKENRVLPAPEKLPESETCLLWRQELKTQFRTLESDEAAVLSAAQQGANFAELCEQLALNSDYPEEVALRAVGYLKTWLSQGLIAGLTL